MSFSRRKFLQAGSLAALGSAVSLSASAESRILTPTNKKRVLRVAHLTDIHVQPQSPARMGLRLLCMLRKT